MSEPEVEVEIISADEVGEALSILEEVIRGGEPLTERELRGIASHIEAGTFEVVAARDGRRVIGVATLCFRPSVSLGGTIASVEDLYVAEDTRRVGTGRGLLRKVEEVCRERDVYYVEVQVEEESAAEFYVAVGFEVERARVMSVSYPFSSGRVGENSITS